MQQILLIVQILVGVGLVAVVLLQHGRGADAGAAFGGGGGAGTMFGARGPGTLLTRVTAILATVFFLNSLGLAYAARQQSLANRSVMEQFEAPRPSGPEDVPTSSPTSAGGNTGTASDVPTAPSATTSGNSETKSQQSGEPATDVPKAPTTEKNDN